LATNAEQLSGQAQMLKENISYFQIGNKKQNKSIKKPEYKAKAIPENKLHKKDKGGFDLKMYDDKHIDGEYEKF